MKCELHCILKQMRCLLRVAGVLEDHIFEAPEVRGYTVSISNRPALTGKSRCNSGSNNYDNSSNIDNKSSKSDFQWKLPILFGKAITMGTKQMTKEKPEKDIKREP